MDEETRLKVRLQHLQNEYRAKAQPIIDRLTQLEAMKPPPMLVIPKGTFGKLLMPDLYSFHPDNHCEHVRAYYIHVLNSTLGDR